MNIKKPDDRFNTLAKNQSSAKDTSISSTDVTTDKKDLNLTVSNLLQLVDIINEEEILNNHQIREILFTLISKVKEGKEAFTKEEGMNLILDCVDKYRSYEVEILWNEYNKKEQNVLDYSNFTPKNLADAISQYQIYTDLSSIALFVIEKSLEELWKRDGEFTDLFDPVSKYELLKNGKVGTLMGIDVYTDAYLPDERKFINGVQLRYKENNV